MDLGVKTGDKNNAQIMEFLSGPSSGNVTGAFLEFWFPPWAGFSSQPLDQAQRVCGKGEKQLMGLDEAKQFWRNWDMEASTGRSGLSSACGAFLGKQNWIFGGWKPGIYHLWGSKSFTHVVRAKLNTPFGLHHPAQSPPPSPFHIFSPPHSKNHLSTSANPSWVAGG